MFCEKCGNSMTDDSLFCPVCGAKQSQPEQSVPEISQNPFGSGQFPPPDMSYQQNSGQFMQGGGNYGFPPEEPSKSGSKILIIVVISLTVLILALGGALAYFMLSGEEPDTSGRSSSSDNVRPSHDDDDEKDGGDDEPAGKVTEPDEPKTKPEAATEKVTKPDNSYSGIAQRMAERQNVKINYVSSDVSDYPIVKLYFTVEDQSGNTARLSSPNVAVKEKVSNGQELEREVKSVEQLEGKEGVSFALVADKSGSMSYDMPKMQSIMSEFVDALDYSSGDKAELIAFDSYVMYMCTYSSDAQLLKNGINNMSAYGETSLYDALYEGVANAGTQRGARCVIAFTDGSDNTSVHTAAEVIDLANNYSVPVFIIGTSGSNSDYSNITSLTGGAYWNINSISDMGQILDQIYAQEKEMYCLEYVSDSAEDRYNQRSINLAVEDGTYGAITQISFTPTETLQKQTHSSRYELIKADVTWSEANAECIKRGGHLITITSDEEMKKASEMAEAAGLKYIWMGGYTSIKGNTAYGHWITGEQFNYQKWYPGEPSRNDKDGEEEMYLMLWKIGDEWSWNDQRNDVFNIPNITYFKGATGYICEYED